MGNWGNLTEALRTGKPQNEARDGSEPSFVAIYAHPAQLKSFLGSNDRNQPRCQTLPSPPDFPWRNYNTFADIGDRTG